MVNKKFDLASQFDMGERQLGKAEKVDATEPAKNNAETVKKAAAETAQKPEKDEKTSVEKGSATKAKDGENKLPGSRRGRPRVHPEEIDNQGQKMTGMAIKLESDLNMFLEFCLEQDKSIKSKEELAKMILRKALETNRPAFEEWKKVQLSKPTYKIEI